MEFDLIIETKIQIQQPVSKVFEAIINPHIMKNYFISKGSDTMAENKQIIWNFPEFDLDFPIQVLKIVPEKYIFFTWQDQQNKPLQVKIYLAQICTTDTIVKVTEQGRKNDDDGIKWLKDNTEGWANFLACLKAWLDHGINLRKGAFEFLKNI